MFGPDITKPAKSRPVSTALATLQAASETEPPASLMAAHMPLSSTGFLRGATHDGIVVELPHLASDALRPGAVAALSFPLAGRPVGFTSEVLSVQMTDRGVVRVTLAVPETIRTDNLRASIRIPVPDRTLSAAVLENEKPLIVRAIDISLHGILIEFPRDRVPEIDEGTHRMLVLKLGQRKVLLEAEVRRRDGARYGMAFVVRGDRPPKLVKIIAQLQYLSTAT